MKNVSPYEVIGYINDALLVVNQLNTLLTTQLIGGTVTLEDVYKAHELRKAAINNLDEVLKQKEDELANKAN